MVGDLQRQFKGVTVPVNIGPANGASATVNVLKNVQQQAREASTSLNTMGTALERVGGQAGASTRNLLGWGIAAGAIYKLTSAMREGVGAAVAFERSMNKVAQVGGDSRSEIAGIASEVTRLSTALGVSSKSLADAAIVLRQAGLNAKETKTSLEALALSDLAPTFDGIRSTTEALIGVFRQFKTPATEFKSVLGSINAVSAEFAVESGDLVTAIQKAGGAFANTGGQLNEFLALVTSVRATTRESASEIATGFLDSNAEALLIH